MKYCLYDKQIISGLDYKLQTMEVAGDQFCEHRSWNCALANTAQFTVSFITGKNNNQTYLGTLFCETFKCLNCLQLSIKQRNLVHVFTLSTYYYILHMKLRSNYHYSTSMMFFHCSKTIVITIINTIGLPDFFHTKIMKYCVDLILLGF